MAPALTAAERASRVKLMIFDVDGVLTDGSLLFTAEGDTMKAFNCYACHERGEVGGVEEALNPHFTGTFKEWGDEVRIPPSLTGVGAKMKPGYLKKIFEEGSHDRPYMFTRMPGFGNSNVGSLVGLRWRTDVCGTAAQPDLAVADPRDPGSQRHVTDDVDHRGGTRA